MKRIISIWTILLLSMLCISAAKKEAGASHDVSMKEMKFDPAQLKIAVGDTVVWTNNDDRDHTVVASDNSFKSDNLSKGSTFEHKFTKAGKFSYACSYHPRMKGTIVVGGN